MSNTGYTIIPDEFLDLDLDVYETIILAVIYGFSQDGESTFQGSQNYLARKAKCKRNKVAKSLKKLVDLGLIKKYNKDINGVHLCEYKASFTNTGCIPEIQGCVPEIHNNINDNIDIKERECKRTRFQKPTIEEIREYCEERNNGIDAEEFWNFYESKGWMVGKSPMKNWKAAITTWEKSHNKERKVAPKERKESVFAQNLKTADQMFGTNLYQQAYGNNPGKHQ